MPKISRSTSTLISTTTTFNVIGYIGNFIDPSFAPDQDSSTEITVFGILIVILVICLIVVYYDSTLNVRMF